MAHADDYWTPERVRLFDVAVRRSDFPAKFVEALEPILSRCRDALDVGAGVGALALPLARRLQAVTALDPSPTMLECLRANATREGLRNLTTVPGEWGSVLLRAHDLILMANVAPLFDRLETFLSEATPLARRGIAIVQNAGPGTEKFYFGELYPLLLGRPYPSRRDYLHTVTLLHERGIFADVRIVEYDFDQPFADLKEAVGFWAAQMRLEAPEQVERLTAFLRERLRGENGGLLAPMHRRSAVVWWPTA